MFELQFAREAPIELEPVRNDPTRPAVPQEPELAIGNIQGNVIGFNKDYQTLLFLKIVDAEQFRQWLRMFVPFVATAAEVLQFNRLFKEIRRRRRVETRTVQATWINIAFSYAALDALSADAAALQASAVDFPDYSKENPAVEEFKADQFNDRGFKLGMAARAVEELGDPRAETAEGNPRNWLFGGTDNEADVVIIVASDSHAELHGEVARIEESLYSGHAVTGERVKSGARIIYNQQAATLPPPLTGHEHFGFLDGVSQPGLRGRISADPTDVLTLRQNPANPDQGKPGQDLVWPGEFIFGYRRQKHRPERAVNGRLPAVENGPVWARDGSFLVVRRLRQDVPAFHKFLDDRSRELGMPRERLGAKLVGRWPGGAPTMRKPDEENRALGNDECANNHFEFQASSGPIKKPPGPHPYCEDVKDEFPPSPGDPDGLICPFAAHIRKAYPRDDRQSQGDDLDEVFVQTRRMLRRGIPFGDPYYPPPDPANRQDSGNRGLLFIAHMTSIVNQFEFVVRDWINEPEFKDKSDGQGLRSGHDLLIGQSNTDGKRTRQFVLPLRQSDGSIKREVLTAEEDWVIPTGGGYFFAPSIAALCLLSGAEWD